MYTTRKNNYYSVPALAVRKLDDRFPLHQAQDELDKVFGGVFRDLLSPWLGGSGRVNVSAFLPRIDVTSTDAAYDISVELPGVDSDQVAIEVKDDLLVLKGEKRQAGRTENTEEGVNNAPRMHLGERWYGSFERAVSLPEDADADNISATYKNGILHINIPRRAPLASQARTIAISKE